MKSGFTLVLSVVFLSGSAFAASSPSETLVGMYNNRGSVSRAFQVTYGCELVTVSQIGDPGNGAEEMVMTVKTPLSSNRTVATIKYTNDVPNLDVLRSKVADAALTATVSSGIPPVGGSTTHYVAGTIDLLDKAGSSVYRKNPSASAAQLVDFLDLNCRVMPSPIQPRPMPRG